MTPAGAMASSANAVAIIGINTPVAIRAGDVTALAEPGKYMSCSSAICACPAALAVLFVVVGRSGIGAVPGTSADDADIAAGTAAGTAVSVSSQLLLCEQVTRGHNTINNRCHIPDKWDKLGVANS